MAALQTDEVRLYEFSHPYAAPGADAHPAGHDTVALAFGLDRTSCNGLFSELWTESAQDIVGMAAQKASKNLVTKNVIGSAIW